MGSGMVMPSSEELHSSTFKIKISTSSMAWHPQKPEIAAIDIGGYWCIVSDIADVKNVAKSVEKASKVVDNEDEEMLNDEEVPLITISN